MLMVRQLIKVAIRKFKIRRRPERARPFDGIMLERRPPREGGFHFSKAETQAESLELPVSYGETRLVLLPVNPSLVHAYWEIGKSDFEKVNRELGKAYGTAKPVLRFYDIPHPFFDGPDLLSRFDIEIDLQTRNSYIHLSGPEKSNVADLGFKTAQDKFLPVVRSNVVHTPGTWPGGTSGESWKLAEEGKKTSWESQPVRPNRIEGERQEQKSFSAAESVEAPQRRMDDLHWNAKLEGKFFETSAFRPLAPEGDLTEMNEREFVSGFSSMKGTERRNR